MPRTLVGSLALALTLVAVAGCARPATTRVQPATYMFTTPTTPAYSGTVVPVVTYLMSGTVQSISHGLLHLSGVECRPPAGAPMPSADLRLPPGRWVSRQEWQSRGDTVDVFVGEPVTYHPESHQLSPGGARLRSFQARVGAVTGAEVTWTTYQGVWGDPSAWTAPTGTVTLRMAPYSWARTGAASQPVAALHVGDAAIVLWFGDASDTIAWQVGLL